MGFGKESHLLNPEPSIMSRDFQKNNNGNELYVLLDPMCINHLFFCCVVDDKSIKKRRTE